MSRLSGKGVLVTGGGSGIGLASARLLLAEGAKVAIAGRNEAKLKEAVASLGAGACYHAADLSDPAQVAEMVKATTAKLGSIDILVNNAGMNVKDRTFAQLTPQGWQELLAGNLDNAFQTMHAVLPQMRQRGSGVVIIVNSISGLRANPLGGTGYIAAKFGLRGLAMAVGAEEKPHNIRVTSIFPGEVNTPILEQRPEPVSDQRKAAMLQPEDVASAVHLVATLPEHVSIPELIICPSNATYI